MKRLREIKGLSRFKQNLSSTIDLDFLAEIAIGLWRVDCSLKKEFHEIGDLENKRTWKHLQRLLSALHDKGLVIQDRIGETYDEGMSLRVVSAEERDDLERKLIIETVTPTIFFRENIIRAGEVVIGKPAEKKAESPKS